ncbi:MAG: bifunctional riboflavin kinase/FAD synthetase [Methylococcaceae bacterium]|nr:bifunctional riboflavin kinase/FAD synthetase [Methylococcaceae bacterium]
MQVIRGLINLRKLEQGCALTIGNFDGVHRGHQAVISKLAEKALELNLPVVVMLFEPQPLEYFRPEETPARLSRLRDKVLLLRQLQVHYLLILRFNCALSRLSPAEFVQQILVDGLNTKYLVVGDDFRFGYGRSGDYESLLSLAAQFGFTVESTGSHSVGGERVSSTLIRDALAAGDLDSAKRFLGRPFSINGKVIPGKQNGRAIGFPTANIAILRKNPPVRGVFAVTMSGFRDREWAGVANVGVRPTFGGDPVFFLEVHLFDFEWDLYGSHVEVHFHEKIRDEIRFNSLDELKQRIGQDVVLAREILGRRFGVAGNFIDPERPGV